jgi:flagellar motility protein MotE (MotC chaperone)
MFGSRRFTVAKKSPEMEVEKESGGMGRFLFIATPILFTLVLVGVIVMLFNVDLRKSMFNTLDQIPIVKNWVPSADKESSTTASATQTESNDATVKALKEKLDAANVVNTKQQTTIDTLEEEKKTKELADATAAAAGTAPPTGYQKQIKNLSKVYAEMSSSKAAAIMQVMTTDEQVLILNEMNATDQAGILQKMDPKIAAETSLALRNAKPTPANAPTVATTPASTSSTKLDAEAMAQTFTSMPASSAATLLLQTAKVSQTKVLQILNTMDDSTRSSILAAMSTTDPTGTAQIVNKLLGN